MSPNAITLETEAKVEGIYEMRNFPFYPAGVTVKIAFCVFWHFHTYFQVSTVASKPETWSLMGNSVVFNAMMERVDEADKPKPLAIGWIKEGTCVRRVIDFIILSSAHCNLYTNQC